MIEFSIELHGTQAAILNKRKAMRASGRAMRKALSSGIRATKAEAVRRVRDARMLRARDVRAALTTRRAKGSKVEGMSSQMDVGGKRISLMAYNPRQVRRGVSVKVERGKRTVIPGAFLARMDSGHTGVFTRRGIGKQPGRVADKRVGRLPIDERLGSRPVDILRKSGQADAVARRGADVARQTFARVLPLELDKLS